MTNRIRNFWCYQLDSVIRTKRNEGYDLGISVSSFGATHSLLIADCSTIRQIKWQFIAKRTEKKEENQIERHQTSGHGDRTKPFTQYYLGVSLSKGFSFAFAAMRINAGKRVRILFWAWKRCGRCFARSMVNNNRINFKERAQAAHF